MRWLGEVCRRAAAVVVPARKLPAGCVELRLVMPEYSAARLAAALGALPAAAGDELERLREEKLELEEMTRLQAARIEELERNAAWMERVHGDDLQAMLSLPPGACT